jgi:hypothetical protein
VRIDAHVGDAGDGGAGLLGQGGEGYQDKECAELGGDYFHWLGHGTYTSEDSIRTPREGWQAWLVGF